VAAVEANAAQVHLAAAVDVDGVRVEEFCAQHGIGKAYTDAATMLAKEQPELVLIATPPATHAHLSVMCMEAGAWVLCEKPLCGSLTEMDLIEAAEARTGKYTSSVFQYRFGSGGQHLKRLIEQGTLGKPLVCTSLVTWYRTPEYYAVPWRGRWATELGGCSMGHGIHAMDFVLWLLGGWREVRAMMGTLDRAIEVEDVSMASVRFDNGAMANLTNSVLSPREVSYLRLDFQRATVELTHLYSYTNADWRYSTYPNSPYGDALLEWQAIGEDVRSSHAAQLRAFLASMGRGARPPVSGPDVRGTIEFLASLYKSAMTGEAVMRGSIQPGDPFYAAMGGKAGKVTG
jgi:predicted dehydrogenase